MRSICLLFALLAFGCSTEPRERAPSDASSSPADAGVSDADQKPWSYLIHVPPAPNDPTSNYQFVNGIAVDSHDNVLVAGRGVDVIELGAAPTGTGYLYLSKFSSDGVPLWARRFGTGAFAEIRSIA